jgi:hypothetical protein
MPRITNNSNNSIIRRVYELSELSDLFFIYLLIRLFNLFGILGCLLPYSPIGNHWTFPIKDRAETCVGCAKEQTQPTNAILFTTHTEYRPTVIKTVGCFRTPVIPAPYACFKSNLSGVWNHVL